MHEHVGVEVNRVDENGGCGFRLMPDGDSDAMPDTIPGEAEQYSEMKPDTVPT